MLYRVRKLVDVREKKTKSNKADRVIPASLLLNRLLTPTLLIGSFFS
jgi:hypothetical protein